MCVLASFLDSCGVELMTKMITKTLLACAAGLAVASAANAVSFTNGSFESGSYNGDSDFDTLGVGSTAMTGWLVEAGTPDPLLYNPVPTIKDDPQGVDWVANYWNAQDGDRSVDLNSLNAGALSQTLSGLVAGTQYFISFFYSGNPEKQDDNPALKTATFSINQGGPAISHVITYDVDAEGNTLGAAGDMKWKEAVYSFVATGSDATIRISSNLFGATGVVVDNFSISAAPDAATWLTMIFGFGGAGMVLRRQRAKLATA